MKSANSPIDQLRERVESGILDTEDLRQKWSMLFQAASGEVWRTGSLIGHPVIYCDSCGLPCFAGKTKAVYNGAHWVCEEQCFAKYAFCAPCRSYVLLDDLNNPTHIHDGMGNAGLLYFPVEQPIAVYNADVMEGGKGKFFKTAAEHQLLSRRKVTSTDPERIFRNFGIEIEVEKLAGGPPDVLTRTRKALGSFVMIKHDGSLSRRGKGGFEIVSMPATLAYHEGGAWSSFFKDLGPFFQEQPPTTGLHIHIGRNTLSPLTVDKLIMFVNAEENREFIYGMANRNLLKQSPNGRLYAAVKKWNRSEMMRLKQHGSGCPWHPGNKGTKNYFKMVAGQVQFDPFGNPIIASITGDSATVRAACKCTEGHYNIEHYEAVNLRTHRPTVELRIFRGLVNEQFFYACLEFADSISDFCETVPFESLHYKNYLSFLKDKTKRYRNLYRLLVNQCWIDPPKSKHEIVPAYGIYA